MDAIPLKPTEIWRAEGLRAGFPAASDGEIRDVGLLVHAGEKIALVGPEHGGRAMLFKVLAGLRPVRGGRLVTLGHELTEEPWWVDWDQLIPSTVRRKMGVLLDREGLLSNVSVREGLELLFRFKNGDSTRKHIEAARTMVDKLGHRFGITDCLDKRPTLLTAAERRLAGLARAFLSKPSVLLLENPTVGFGDLSRERLENVMTAMFAESARTIVVSTDNLRFARRFCPRWILVDEGGIVFDGPATELIRDPDSTWGTRIRQLVGEAA